ncbi:3-keto-disaccharide hydrolase [Echinicola pacifica]|nr:DUF1080 domain-containing protein [Echinicola pacifica]
MSKFTLPIFLLACILMVIPNLMAQNRPISVPDKVKSKDWRPMIDEELSLWEVWTGIPDPSVENLPADYTKEPNGENKVAIGLGDPMGIYEVSMENGEPVLNISGQVYAGLTSKEIFSNYHLTLLFKWGEKKYEPRLNRKRDNGVLYHCYGEHGAFWKVWKSSLEYQVQEGDFGDLYNLAGTSNQVTVDEEGKWSPHSEKLNTVSRTIRSQDLESPHGQWTRIDIYVLEDQSIHMTNGTVVLALKNAKDKQGKPLMQGQLQLQSEGAECYMKDIHIRPISKFPKAIQKAAGL